ncbi:tRNA pseudouridine(13) synthase TruD [Arcobacter sp. YIC-80]|uniref:tRNA pseudouridine(13) synthase TruD n=1 Tax=Arcobacter sp. YIC-80 TaxID=3376683 RepID=UPI00385135AD
MIKRVYNHSAKVLNFEFIQNENDFIVDEIPLRFSNSGNFIILKVKKVNLDTWDLIETFAKYLNIYTNEIGYAGLKDKKATTTQYISIPKKYLKKIQTFRSNKIQILETILHNKKLNIGDLKGNRFRINLHNTSLEDLNHIQRRLKKISKEGLLNYFGYQRFGRDVEENLRKAKELIEGEKIIKDRKLSKMLIMAYQSNFFNSWLVNRTKTSKTNFDLINGDVFLDIKKQKYITPKIITKTIEDSFSIKNIVPTGLLPGRKVFRAIGEARAIEEKFDDTYIQDKGYRREAIIFPKDVICKFSNDKNICTLEFSLSKGSYATVLVEYLANKNFS